ncbi:PTS sugar transporter subunit IIC [Petroclostridium sp. X23]|jgi:D-glucosaminate-specific PTS system IIC component|uniref:PTS mannose/fructose/sorbose/N-acetylgalactosamine transporter subunit IIC n=1 Tax=Petroclostridium sp. X23 TaxID=3045146 RepID=UPI0024ACF02C|nr:PTS sugar transporter subunit IIC [Petroclostridium sp. X23]WHH60500.1 PTS sugar transporter subunit IIC [Petroclostridium sp. X23]
MSFIVAMFTGLWYWIAQSKIGYTFHAIMAQPIVMALPIGMLMGDVPMAMKIGASIEMVYLGMVAAGANIPADECLAGVIAIPIALKSGIDPETAVVLAVPFGLLGVFQDQIRRTLHASFAHKADKYALEGNDKGIERCAILFPMLLGFLLRFPLVFAANLFGGEVVQNIIQTIPTWIMHGLSVAGGVLPALGFAITVFIIGKKTYIPYFIVGFFVVKYLGVNIMASAIFGTCIALLTVFMRREALGGESA